MKPSRRGLLTATIGVVLTCSLFTQVLWSVTNAQKLRDYGSFIAAGKALEDGDNPYGIYEDTYVAYIGDTNVEAPNLNPPLSLYVFSLLDDVDPYSGKLLLNIVSLVLYALVVRALLRDAGRNLTPGMALWFCSLAGLWHLVELGQIYVFLLAALTCAWISQERRPLLAGLLIGVVIAIKPNFAIWPALLFLSGERTTSLSALGTAAGLSVLPFLSFGLEVYHDWIEASRAFTGIAFANNASLLSVFARAGVEEAGYVASAVMLALVGAWAFLARPSSQQAAEAGLLTALILGPITWSGYTLLALPVLLNRCWHGWEIAAASTLIVPVWVVLSLAVSGSAGSFLAGSMYAWGLFILLGLIGRDAYARFRNREIPQETPAPIEELQPAAA